MAYRVKTDERGNPVGYTDTATGEHLTPKEYEKRVQMQQMAPAPAYQVHNPALVQAPQMPYQAPQMQYQAPQYAQPMQHGQMQAGQMQTMQPYQDMVHYPGRGPLLPTDGVKIQPRYGQMNDAQMNPYPYGQMAAPQYQAQNQIAGMPMQMGGQMPAQSGQMPAPAAGTEANPLIQPGARMLNGVQHNAAGTAVPLPANAQEPQAQDTLGTHAQPLGKSLRMESVKRDHPQQLHPNVHQGRKGHGFLDATSIAILLPTLVLLALIIAAAHKKRLFPWQTIRTFNPPLGIMMPRDYEKSFVCPPNLRKHGRLGKRNPNATWTDADGVVLPFGFLARTHLPVTIPMGRLPNKNMFLVAPSGSGKTTLMRAIIKSLLAKPCVIIALEAKANDPNLDQKKEGFKYTVLPEAQHAGFNTLYFNPLDSESVHWNPLEVSPVEFASSIVTDVNSLDAEEQHWAERDLGYIEGLAQLLKWGAVMVVGEDENGSASAFEPLPCNPYGLMKLVNNRRNIVESLRQMKSRPDLNASDLGELTQRLSSIIRTDADWDKNIQGVRGRLRAFKNECIQAVTHQSNIDLRACMHKPTVLIFGAPASLGPDAESLAACFVYQLQQALHTRYGTINVLPLFAFFDEYQTLNIDLAGRLSAIVRGANGGLTVILQNCSQVASGGGKAAEAELRTIFSNSAIRVCLHNSDEYTAAFFSEEIGKHAVVVPGIADHYQATGFGIFPTSWNRIHSQQVVARVDTDSIKRMEKHHALVYLAPAGDPEYGETKPFMVDLRGIEEIARLHLLHNVSGKDDDGGDDDGPDGGNSPEAMQAQLHPMPTSRTLPVAAKQVIGQIVGSHSNGAMNANAGQEMEIPSNVQPAQQATSYAAPTQNQMVQAQMNPMAQAAQMAQPASQGDPNANAGMCPHCNKRAGKGKFCIECGKSVALAPAQASPMPQPAQMAQAAQPTQAVQAALPTQAAQASAQARAGIPQPRYGGLEVQSRDAMPSKRPSMIPNASQVAQMAQRAQHQASSDDQGFGPLSQRVARDVAGAIAEQSQQGQPVISNHRQPVTSLTPDVSRLGLKPQTGVEF
ncbi:MAG: type IV secretory system conjugative DNA transfer family protein [Candidatus Melainabacteria bacterium]|nr:type IV secretory system conjugative DNA transfer family protein [Candidatus Melainabacteria bacterium]